jgi:hypothetical protein
MFTNSHKAFRFVILTSDYLTIDFSSRHCFGFDREVEHFTRE